MEYQEKLIILPAVQDMKEPMTITAHEAIGTGLCYHAVCGDASMGWGITHLESKKAICQPVGTEHEARLLMKKVAGLTDWNQSEKEIYQHLEFVPEFKKCQQAARQELNMQIEACAHACMPDYLVEDVMNEVQDNEYPVLRNALLYAFKIIPSNVGG